MGLMIAKSQGGMNDEMVAEFKMTSQNPVLLDTLGLFLFQYNIPSLPQMPPSSRLLKTLWPRLQTTAVRNRTDPLWPVCDAGASGNESAAVECMKVWHSRIPTLQMKL